MANGSNKDVNLRIRSQSDAEKTFRDIADAIEDTQKQLGLLNKAAEQTDTTVDDLSASFKAIETASAKLKSSGALDRYFKEVGSAAVAAQAKLTKLRVEAQKLAADDDSFVGPRTTEQIAKQEQAYRRLQTALTSARAELDKQLATYRQVKAAQAQASQAARIKAEAEATVAAVKREVEARQSNIAAVKAEAAARTAATQKALADAQAAQARFQALTNQNVSPQASGEARRRLEVEYAESFDRIAAIEKRAAAERAAVAEKASAAAIKARKAEEAALIEQFETHKKVNDAITRSEQKLTAEVEGDARKRTSARKQESAAARAAGAGASPFKIDTNGARQTLDFTQRLRGQLLALASAYVGVYGAINQFNAALEQQRTLTGVQSRLAVSLGTNDAKAIGNELAFIREQADRLGLSFVPLADSFSRFQAAASQAGAGLSETRVIFTRIAEAGRVLNLSTEDVQGTFKALEQIFSKGKVQAEELRGQLGDRLPGAVAILAKALGKPQAELNDLLEKGLVTSDVLLDFANKVGDAYSNGLGKATQGLSAELNRTQNVYADIRQEFVQSFEPFLIDMLKELRTVLASPEFKQGIRGIAVALGELLQIIPSIVKNMDLLVAAFVALSAPRIISGLAFIVTWGKQVLAAFALLRGGAATLTVGMTALGGAIKVAGVAIRGLAAASGIAALVTIAYQLYSAFTDTNDAVDETSASMANLAYQEQQAAEEAARRLRIEQEIAQIQNRVRAAQSATADALKFVNEEDETRKLDTLGKKLKKAADDYDDRISQIKKASAEALDALTSLAVPVQGNGESDADFERRLREEAKRRVEEQIKIATDEKVAVVALEQQKNDQLAFLRREAGKEAADARKKDQEDALRDLDQFASQLLDKTADLNEKLSKPDAAKSRAASIKADFDIEIDKLDALAKRTEGLVRPEYIQRLKDAAAKVRDLKLEEDRLEASRRASEASQKRVREQEDSINQVLAIRESRISEINAEQESGTLTQLQAQQAVRDVYAETNDMLVKQIQLLIASGELTAEQMEKYRVLLKQIERANKEADNFFLGMNENMLAERAADGLTDAFFQWADGIKSAGDALREFAAEFLRFMAEAIIKQQILNLLKAIGVGVAHEGGVIGSTVNRSRSVSPMAFLGAPRYHSGGLAGLAPDEVPAILQRGEEVLTRDDPRHILNGGGQQAGAAPAQPQDITVVNAVDSESVFMAGASSPSGRRVIMNVIQANRSAIRQLLG